MICLFNVTSVSIEAAAYARPPPTIDIKWEWNGNVFNMCLLPINVSLKRVYQLFGGVRERDSVQPIDQSIYQCYWIILVKLVVQCCAFTSFDFRLLVHISDVFHVESNQLFRIPIPFSILCTLCTVIEVSISFFLFST